MLETLNSVLSIPSSVCLKINRDCFLSEEELELYRSFKLENEFDFVFETLRNEAGYSRDVHGQLYVYKKGENGS